MKGPSSESNGVVDIRDILSTFPRTRVGLILPSDVSAAVNMVNQFRDVAAHFLYRYHRVFPPLFLSFEVNTDWKKQANKVVSATIQLSIKP